MLYEAHPNKDEVVVASLPPGSTLRVHHPQGAAVDYSTALPGDPLIIVVVGDTDHLGWGCGENHYMALRAVRNQRHPLDLPVWEQAVRALRRGGVLCIAFRRESYYSGHRWTADHVRFLEQVDASPHVSYIGDIPVPADATRPGQETHVGTPGH